MLNKLIIKIEADSNNRSTWNRACKTYAIELIEYLSSDEIAHLVNCARAARLDDFRKVLLNGAQNWAQFSFGGCALVYDADIDERLNPPSQRGRCSSERLLRTQARALYQAERLIYRACRKL